MTPLTFFEHARQTYGALPLHDDASHEWTVSGRPTVDGEDDRGEFRIALHTYRGRESYQRDETFVKTVCYCDAAGAMRDFVAAGGYEALVNVAGPDDVTAALLRCGLIDRSDFAERVVSCPCCIGMGKVRAEDRAALEGVLAETKASPHP